MPSHIILQNVMRWPVQVVASDSRMIVFPEYPGGNNPKSAIVHFKVHIHNALDVMNYSEEF